MANVGNGKNGYKTELQIAKFKGLKILGGSYDKKIE